MRIDCGQCGQTLEIPAQQLAQGISCPICGAAFGAEAASAKPARAGSRFGWFSNCGSAVASGVIHATLALLIALVPVETPQQFSGVDLLPSPPMEKEADHTPVDTTFDPPEIEVGEATSEFMSAMPAIKLGAASGSGEVISGELEVALGGDGLAGTELDVGGGTSHSVSFLGVSAEGRYMCIIADKSGSMDGAKLAELKTEFRKTLNEMGGAKLCKIVFFDDQAKPYASGDWRNPKRDRPSIDAFLDSISAEGGTEPLVALRLVFAAERVPDAIWLMTDGEFAPVAEEVLKLNIRQPKTIINTISFQGGKNAELEQIANDNGGKYHAY